MSVWDQKWKRERDGDGRGDMRKRQHSRDGQYQVVHSLDAISVIFETIHDPMAPYLPSPWPLGTWLSAFAQVVPSPDLQGPLAYEQ